MIYVLAEVSDAQFNWKQQSAVCLVAGAFSFRLERSTGQARIVDDAWKDFNKLFDVLIAKKIYR